MFSICLSVNVVIDLLACNRIEWHFLELFHSSYNMRLYIFTNTWMLSIFKIKLRLLPVSSVGSLVVRRPL